MKIDAPPFQPSQVLLLNVCIETKKDAARIEEERVLVGGEREHDELRNSLSTHIRIHELCTKAMCAIEGSLVLKINLQSVAMVTSDT